MANLIFQPSAIPKKEHSLPKEAKEYAYYNFDDQRTLLGLPSKFQGPLDKIKVADKAGYQTVYDDVMEEWQYVVQDCFDPKKITDILEKKYSFPRRQLDKFSKLKSHDNLIRRNKFYFPSDRNKRKDLTKDIRKHILDGHSPFRDLEKILKEAGQAVNRLSYAPDAEKKHCPKYTFEKPYPLILVAMALEEMSNKAKGQTASYSIILNQIFKLNSGFNRVTDGKQTICLPLRGAGANITQRINTYIDQNLRGKCFIADGKYDMRPVMIAMERLGYLPSNFKGQDGLKRQEMLMELNISCDVIKPKNGTLIYFGVDLGQSKSKEICDYLRENLSGPDWVKKFKGSDKLFKLVEPFRANVTKFREMAEHPKNSGEVEVIQTYRPEKRAWLMHYIWNIINKNIDYRKIPNDGGVDIIWDHGDPTITKKALQEMYIAYKFLKYEDNQQGSAINSDHKDKKAVDMKINNLKNELFIPKELVTTPWGQGFMEGLEIVTQEMYEDLLGSPEIANLQIKVENLVNQMIGVTISLNGDLSSWKQCAINRDLVQVVNLFFGFYKLRLDASHWQHNQPGKPQI